MALIPLDLIARIFAEYEEITNQASPAFAASQSNQNNHSSLTKQNMRKRPACSSGASNGISPLMSSSEATSLADHQHFGFGVQGLGAGAEEFYHHHPDDLRSCPSCSFFMFAIVDTVIVIAVHIRCCYNSFLIVLYL